MAQTAVRPSSLDSVMEKEEKRSQDWKSTTFTVPWLPHAYLFLFVGYWTGVWKCADFSHIEVPDSYQMNFRASLEMASANESIKRDTAITVWIFVCQVRMGDIFMTVDQDVRMSIAPYQRAVLYSRKDKEGVRERHTKAI
jgi:hypothetical protein